MPRFEIDVDPLDHITADALGKPGKRVFYIQAWQDQRTFTVIIEKFQLQSLSVSVEQFIAEMSRQAPEIEDVSGDYDEDQMRINPPVEPLFRVGEVGLGYDKERDRIVLQTRELLVEDDDQDTAAIVRFWCTREQIRKMARWGAEVVMRGRPTCPQCSAPMDAESHFCPKKNGHKH
ncbi:MAG: DUF3090 domain-containing protein [Anaerolineae bacterium]|nr:DUF3090 domain-containing protein [Anaerolineae bacterium]MDK1117742.1 DUF3090 domain-containing protein [Anaerolineae bacterium]